MTGLPNPLRRQLLIRASMNNTPEHERDRILLMFPGLDREQALAQLAAARHARTQEDGAESDRIIAGLIQQDKEARA